MKRFSHAMRLFFGGLLCGIIILTGCEGGGDSHLGDGHDFGDNNSDLYAAVGDSITEGLTLSDPSARFSDRLAGMLNKTVINAGYAGYETPQILSVLNSVLNQYKPGYVLILAGVNDIIMGYGEDFASANIRLMIQACRDNMTIPVVATLTPVTGSYSAFSSGVYRLNENIRQLCSELDVTLVDLSEAFQKNPAFLSDGLHPNEAGHALIAMTFYDVVK